MYSLPNYAAALGLGVLLWASGVHAAQQWRLTIDDIVAPAFSLKGIQATLITTPRTRFDLAITQAQFQQRIWRDVKVRCADARIESERIVCRKGVLEHDQTIPLSFEYRTRTRRLNLTLLPQAQERWQIDLAWRGGQLTGKLMVHNGEITRVNPWLPAELLQFSAGRLTAELGWRQRRGAVTQFDGQMQLDSVAFSDATGNHAGDKLSGKVNIAAQRQDDWQWQLAAHWRDGEVFWAPFYLASAERNLQATGRVNATEIAVDTGSLIMPAVGRAQFSGRWDRSLKRLGRLQATSGEMDLTGLYRIWLKPLLRDSVLGKLQVSGKGSATLSIVDGQLSNLTLQLTQADARHEDGVFSLSGVDAYLPWQQGAPSPAQLRVSDGKFRDLNIGAFHVHARLAQDHIDVEPTQIPVLDGALAVDHFHARKRDGEWSWELSGAIRPISMEQFTKALKWPVMHGSLSGVVPKVTYANRVMEVGGGLLFRLFDGTAVVKNVRILDALGPASRFQANIDMRNLDLDLLTRAFSFGSMLGRLDVQVQGLELANWKPVKFDARVASSPGEYPRKISQRAVENITALGGASGAAAIQRSFLRFFDQFGYERIGLSCKLENDVCLMGGIEDLPQGFLIVKGGGIPALTVIGYNHRVSWSELLERVARATKGNKPIVK